MVWDDQAIRDLRILWTQGHSTSEIGRRLGCSKNAVVGKAHRLDLDDRPSPIKREPGSTGPKLYVPRPKATLPPLPSYEPPPVVAAPVLVQPRVVAPPPPRPPEPLVFRPRAQASCCWPIGEPGTRSFRFCDEASVLGKTYCDEHAKLAYVRIRDRQEDAAA